MKDYDAYLFDWDGTLAQTLEIWLAVTRVVLEQNNIHISDEVIVEKIFGRPHQGFAEVGAPEAKIGQMLKDLGVHGQERIPTAPLYEDVMELLETLKQQNKKIALITSSYRHILDIVLAKHELLELFDLVIAGDDVKAHKPDPEGILFAVEKFGVSKSQVLMIGDSDKDLEAAQVAGVDSLLFYPEQHHVFYQLTDLQKHQPKYVIPTWRKMLDQLR